MGLFQDRIAAIEITEDSGELPTILADLTTAYDADFSGAVARTDELNGDIAARDAEILRLKAINFDLMIAAAVTPEESEPQGDNSDVGDSDEITPDDLFEN